MHISSSSSNSYHHVHTVSANAIAQQLNRVLLLHPQEKWMLTLKCVLTLKYVLTLLL